jgi:hypothetical protein
MKKNTTVELIASSETVSLYSISFEIDGKTEFEKFVEAFEADATYRNDYRRILAALQVVLEVGALERFFRPEGKIEDDLVALPLDSGKLRLYCLRISDQILVIGNGGIKDVKRYEDSRQLLGYVMDLQRFDRLLHAMLESGSIVIEERILKGVENQVFEI